MTAKHTLPFDLSFATMAMRLITSGRFEPHGNGPPGKFWHAMIDGQFAEHHSSPAGRKRWITPTEKLRALEQQIAAVIKQKEDEARIFREENERQELIRAAAPEMYEALRRADQFITNGIDLGFIRMPDKTTPDTAHETPNMIRAAIAKAEGRQP